MTTLESTSVTRERLYRMMRVYKETSLLRAALRVGVFDALGDGHGTPAAIATATGADPRGIRLLLNALVALGLVHRHQDGRFTLDRGGFSLLVGSSPDFYGGMVDVVASDEEWDAMRDLAAAVRNGGSVRDVNAETPGYHYWETFARSVGPVTVPTAGLLAELLEPWSATRSGTRVLDLACGHGIYGFTLVRRLPGATVTCVDWPNVLEITRQHAREQGLDSQARFVSGDMFELDLGPEHDLVLVTNVLHHFSEARATELLSRATAQLAPGGRIGVVGFVAGDDPARDPEPHLFSVLMLAWTNAGEVHTTAAHERMYAAAGLRIEATRRVPGLPFHVTVLGRSS
ncbi:class I SAM-dependent methyltransferase [Amycolatopsis sp. QT-25]|uniref:class I SAM-dependent methyltransferase n=1 Tax=Amycolatopsis sp. QT-25 TaxID=3034022 RepID=UPI0023ED9565|nr:class I SAM-dependent methyltransferase [Amycolatopsis sp. QT-25]WET76814.1 class I SAM-dependent methyltransferase [Amycolatopsis sp. QT-25]